MKAALTTAINSQYCVPVCMVPAVLFVANTLPAKRNCKKFTSAIRIHFTR